MMKTYEEFVSARLFTYTQLAPSYQMDKADLHNLEEIIAYAAKVSNPSSAKQKDMENASKLINYLISHSHWSPLEMVDATIEFETTRDISHQVIRHRSFTFQEFSQRYAEVLTDDDQGIQFVLAEARTQDPKNRQNSNETDDEELATWWKAQQEYIAHHARAVYQVAIQKGLAKETARKILPEGLTTTRAFMKGSIRSWVHYIDLRSANGTQKEHMVLAQAIAEAIQECFPKIKEFTECN